MESSLSISIPKWMRTTQTGSCRRLKGSADVYGIVVGRWRALLSLVAAPAPALKASVRPSSMLQKWTMFWSAAIKASLQRRTIAVFGVEPSKIVKSDKIGYLIVRELIVPGCFRLWMCDFLCSAFISKNRPDIAISSRRICNSRRRAGYRRVFNKTDVNILQCRGFEIAAFEKLSIVKRAMSIAACEAVVGPHGGGWSNLIFCAPGTKNIGIFSPELVAGYIWENSSQFGLEYYCLLGAGESASRVGDYLQYWHLGADITVNLADLEGTLDLADIKGRHGES